MAKKPIKKAAVKKTGKAAAKKSVKSKLGTSKKSPAKAGAGLKVKKPLSEKEIQLREANVIANSEKKKKPASSKRPKKISSKQETSSLLDAIVEGMQERKAKNITILNLKELENRVADYFVICDADSNTHVNSIADSVEETVEKLTSEKPYHSEGHQNGEWILVDYINVVAHIFLKETREHYNIEGLWGDAEITEIKN